jgi:hypothetical protein
VARDIKFDAVQTYLESLVAGPLLDLDDKESEAIQTAINIALVSYWQAFPYTYRDTFTSSIKGSLGFTIDDILAKVFPNSTVRNSAYFLGIAGINKGPPSLFGTNIDSYLLGVPFFNSNNSFNSLFSNGFDYRSMILESTEVDMLTGEVSIEFDPSGNISLITPATWAQFQIIFAFGFYESASLRYLPVRQLELFRKMAGVEFLNIVISGRSQVTIGSDSTFNVSSLVSRRDELKEEVVKQMSDEMIYPMSWG